MTTTVATETAPVRTEHERLLGHAEHLRVAALELPALSNEERRELLDRILDFLPARSRRTTRAKSTGFIHTSPACSATPRRRRRWCTTTSRSAG